jgi:NAD+ synthase (glutamine-hydrolysing)
VKVTIAQLNPVVGDIDGNLSKAEAVIRKYAGKTDLIVFPELFLVGYPTKDLLEKKGFIERAGKALEKVVKLSASAKGTGILIGVPTKSEGNGGKKLFNSAALVSGGKILSMHHKSLLPTYDVFDEARYFDQSPAVEVMSFRGETLGITVCEDAWNDPGLWKDRSYPDDPVEALARKGATILINMSASPFHAGKDATRYEVVSGHAMKHSLPFIYVNQVGANDDVIFDGTSLFVDSKGLPVKVFPSFCEHVETVDTASSGNGAYVPQDKIGAVHDALVLGIRDYLGKTGFSKALVGLSGGIDSAVTCALAVEAIGKDNVLGITMPSKFSSSGSMEDSRKLAQNLGIGFKVVPIKGIHDSYLSTLQEHFAGRKPDVTEENIQARIRGNILMAFSNKFGSIVLSTGNKSEMSIGYCTLYGDMSGGLAVISDVPKTMVYELARHINGKKEIIPLASIEKPPSAELRPGQKDQDTLPPYDVLDRILNEYVDCEKTLDELLSMDFDKDTVKWVVRAVNRNEYKRKQAPPGLKVTTKAFGQGRRMPIAARYEAG